MDAVQFVENTVHLNSYTRYILLQQKGQASECSMESGECRDARVNDVSELAIDRHALRVNLLIGRCNKETL
jgi:hypothetical protein